MLVHALRGSGADPAYLVGGEVRSTGSNAGWGTGEWLVVEADESDRSLLKLDRRVAVLTNAELDHHSTYSSQPRRRGDVPRVPGAAEHAVVWERPELLALADGGPRVWPFDVEPTLLAGRLAFALDGIAVELDGAGRPQRAQRRGRADRDPARSAATSPPPRRRCATSRARGGASSASARRPQGALVVDDYAHHPTEVRATLEAARTLEPATAGRGLPAAPLLAHAARRPRVRRRARPRRPAGGDRDLPGARGRRGLSRA